ncbi:TPA: hypothetical protein DEP58_00275 [Patescibacteria group bacterium]|nr:MAG: hypothetical protein UU98_C0027G0032 [Parcubacteria group bacterium GW2011_GWD2_42_14]HCC04723.1 hypothetical protein [Patescibacteria group bacterium]
MKEFPVIIIKMKKKFTNLKKYSHVILVLVLFIFLSPAFSHAATVIDTDFNTSSWGVLNHGSYWTLQSTGGVGNTGAARLIYSVQGTADKALSLNVASLKSNEYYIDFDVKMQGTPSGGSSFVKLFGSIFEVNKNNMTLGYDAYGNVQKEVAYNMDTLCTARWDGSDAGPGCTTEHVVKSSAIDMRGGIWGHYKAWVKRADRGVSNGEVKVWWNGTLYAHVKNMNSNPIGSATTPGFESIEFGGYSHTTFTGNTWYLWIDNLKVSTDGSQISVPTQPPLGPPTTMPPTPIVGDAIAPAVPAGFSVQ